MNVRVVYDPTPIRNIAVQCPKCEKWFYGRDITTGNLYYGYELFSAQFECPVCGKIFGSDACRGHSNITIKEVDSSEECYKDCLEKKVVWE